MKKSYQNITSVGVKTSKVSAGAENFHCFIANIYLFKFINRTTRKRWEIGSSRHPFKTSENQKSSEVFWCFQGILKETCNMNYVNPQTQTVHQLQRKQVPVIFLSAYNASKTIMTALNHVMPLTCYYISWQHQKTKSRKRPKVLETFLEELWGCENISNEDVYNLGTRKLVIFPE